MRGWASIIVLFASAIAAAGSDFQDAVTALQNGDSVAAEQKLRAELKAHPDAAEAFSLLGVALDNQKKFPEAAEAHRQAVARAASSAGILNNFGNHLLLTNDPQGARDTFLKAVSLDPGDNYANLQLGQMAIAAGNGQEALQYLDRLPAKLWDVPLSAIYRLQALDLSDNRADADALFQRMASATENDGTLSALLGGKLVQIGQFAQAEVFLTHTLARDPTNFTTLYQLGVVASRAGHNERARQVFETALRQQPQNVDVLYGLAFVYSSLKQPEQAVRMLSQAARLAPQRADVQKLLAVTTSDLLAYEDSVAAWDRYIALAPSDDAGRRERGFARANMKQPDSGLPDLEWYVGRHPDDAVGLFELGVAQSINDPEKGLATLDKAVALKADFVDARSARGALNYQQGNAVAALSDLEFAAAKLPDSALVLDRLGQTYVLLDRAQDAVRVLRRAAALAPNDAKTQLHTANALTQAGETAESRTFMNRYRELGGTAAVPARGVIDYLNLTPEQQHAAYRARIEKALADHPEDAAMQVAFLKLSIADGQMEQAAATAKNIASMKPGAILSADAGRAMLTAHQYSLAKELLEQAAAADPAARLDFDLAQATFHTAGAPAGIQRLDRIPEPQRGGDYYIARAQMLDTSGKTDDAIVAAKAAVQAESQRVDLYWQATALMAKNHHVNEALQLPSPPDDAQVLTIRAMLLELNGKTAEAQQLLTDAQHRWPEAAAAWVALGTIQAAHGQAAEARKMLATAASLGAHSEAADPAKLFLSKPPQDW